MNASRRRSSHPHRQFNLISGSLVCPSHRNDLGTWGRRVVWVGYVRGFYRQLMWEIEVKRSFENYYGIRRWYEQVSLAGGFRRWCAWVGFRELDWKLSQISPVWPVVWAGGFSRLVEKVVCAGGMEGGWDKCIEKWVKELQCVRWRYMGGGDTEKRIFMLNKRINIKLHWKIERIFTN